MGYRVAIAGATGNVGRQMLVCLEEMDFPVSTLHLLASERSAGKQLTFKGVQHEVTDITGHDFSHNDLALFAIGSTATKIYAPQAAAAGCFVIDNSSLYRYDPDVPLVVPEVNPRDIAMSFGRRIIANPNCSTAQMVVALKPLYDHAGIHRVIVSTYQSVSGSGRAAMDELREQTASIANGSGSVEAAIYPCQIAFNVIPHIDSFMEDGSTREEWKMVEETRKILDKDIRVSATCVRVPVLVGHGEAITVEMADPLPADKARRLLAAAPGVHVNDERRDHGYTTPLDCAGDNRVHVSRIREDRSVENGLSFWCVADNLRKGAALNAVQIAGLLAREVLKAD
ncbi:MAG: aspartate-semialdehyde dehydrogenase [Rhodobacteraceae bacterium]|nr:aspartate-semialdehyde dehydrogenase [Paracoccaceae bacterium]